MSVSAFNEIWSGSFAPSKGILSPTLLGKNTVKYNTFLSQKLVLMVLQTFEISYSKS